MEFHLGLEITAAILLSLGYALSYHVSRNLIIPAALGGALSWMGYKLVLLAGAEEVLACFVGAVLVGIWAEIFARIMKAPSTIFMIIGVLPLVPGKLIYLTMLAVVEQRLPDAVSYGLQTLSLSITLALSIFITSSVARLIFILQNKLHKGE